MCRYYGVVYIENGAGSFVWHTTNGQVHDTSPPVLDYAIDVDSSDDVLDVDFSLNTTFWGTLFRISDPHTGLANITVQLVTMEGGQETILDSVAVEALPVPILVLRELDEPLVPGRLVWARITSSNKVGLAAFYDTDGWKPDITAPMFVTHPTDGATPGEDAFFQTTAGSIAACWDTVDDESQVDHYLISARKLGSEEQLVEFAPVPRSASASSGIASDHPFVTGTTCAWTSGFDVELGETYQVLVRTVNPLGLWRQSNTSGITVDWTSPVIGRVFIGDDASQRIDTEAQESRSSVTIAWTNITEPNTPLVAVEVALGTRPGLDDVSARAPLPLGGKHVDAVDGPRDGGVFTFNGLALRDGQTVFATIWTTNVVGLVTRRSSAGISIDGSPPIFLELPHMPFVPNYAFPRGFDQQQFYPINVSGSSVIVPVNSFLDLHSGIASVIVSVYESATDPSLPAGVEPGELLPVGYTGTEEFPAKQLVPPTAADVSEGPLSTSFSGVVLTNFTYVWVDVTATNGMGMELRYSSRAVPISTETLTAGFVNDGHAGYEPEDDQAYQHSNTAYSARWAGFTDPRSDIWYRVCLGTEAGRADVRDWEEVGKLEYLDVLQDFEVPVGTTVYATVEAWNNVGVRANATSNGIVMGSDPPTVADVAFDSPSAAVELPGDADTGAVYVAPSPVVLVWTASDAQGLQGCHVEIRSSQGGPLLLEADTGPAARRAEWDVKMPEGQPMHGTVTCTNIRGRSTTALQSTWAVVETTPPVAGKVWDGYYTSEGEYGDVDFSANRTHASAHWFAFSDAESGIDHFIACLGTPNNECSEGEQNVGRLTHVEFTNLNLVDGRTYVWTITAVSGAGLDVAARSDGWTVDFSAPVTTSAFVVDGWPDADGNPAVDADTLTDRSFFEVSWGGYEDVVSSIVGYRVWLGSTEGADNIAAAVTLDASQHMFAFSDLTSAIGSGGFVVATVEAIDSAGNVASLSSDGAFVDDTPPVAPTDEHAIVETAVNSTAAAGSHLSDLDIVGTPELRVAWNAFEDSESGIDRYEVQVEDVTDGSSAVVLEWSSVGTATEFQHVSLPLLHAHTYTVRVRAYNGAGAHSELLSDGVAVDLTPPVAAKVYDGALHADGDVSLSSTPGVVAAHWDPFAEPDSSLHHYTWCVGTAPGKGDVVACHDVGLALSATARVGGGQSQTEDAEVDLAALLAPVYGSEVAAAVATAGVLADGSVTPEVVAAIPATNAKLPTYYSTVTAVSELGFVATSYSDGVRIDVQPPVAGMILDSADPFEADIDLQTSLSAVSVSWIDWAEFQTSLVRFEATVGTTPGGSDVMEAVEIPADRTSATFDGLDLVNGMTYYVTLSAVDETGLVSSNTTDGVLVDATPPEVVFLLDVDPAAPEGTVGEARASTSNSSLTVAWEFQDDESGVASYRVRVCPVLLEDTTTIDGQVSSNCVLEWTDVGLTALIHLTAPALEPGVRYAAEVEATSGAGLSSTATSRGFFVDATPPTEGTVVVVDVADAAAQVAAVAQGMADQQLAAISLQGSWETVGVQWTGFVDQESEVTSYAVCVGSSPLATDLVPCHEVGLVHTAVINASVATAYAADGDTVTLRAGRGNFTSLFVTVIARNGANLTSSAVSAAVQVDASAPVAGNVFTGPHGADVEYSAQPTSLCVSAEGFMDLESDVEHYDVCLGNAPGRCNVAKFRRVPVETAANGDAIVDAAYETLCARGLRLHNHQRVHATVRATNGAGLSTEVSSGSIMIVLQNPTVGTVIDASLDAQDGVSDDGMDTAFYGQRRAVGAVWWDFGTGITPIVSYAVAVCGTVSGCNNTDNALSFFSEIGLATNITLSALALTEGELYSFHIRATDAAGRSSVGVSDGFIIDTTPPTTGSVDVLSLGAVQSVLNPAGINASSPNGQLSGEDVALARSLLSKARADGVPMWHAGYAPMHVAWSAFGDTESGVESYTVCVSSGGNATDDIIPCRTVPSTAGYVAFSADDANQTAVALALEAAAAAAAAAESSQEALDELEAMIDPDTGLVPPRNDTVDVRASFAAHVIVHACNRVGLCASRVAGPVAVDFTPPVPSFVSATLDPAIDTSDDISLAERLYSNDAHAWSAQWDEWADTESGVAFYTAAVVDETLGEFAVPHVAVGMSRSVSTHQIDLQHGHRYTTEVTAYNHAGLSRSARSAATVVDLTPPTGGWVYDIFDLDEEGEEDADPLASFVDADYGDADLATIEARWGGWDDPESGAAGLTYEWAVMVIDPRQTNPISASEPGALLRAAIAKFLDTNSLVLDIPDREYGTGRATRLHEADNGLMFTDWLSVGNATSGVRGDVDITTAATYVVLVRITNAAGLQTVASSDGIIFDRSDPCIGQPHAGLDPFVIPRYLNVEGQLTAVWPASIDPLNQQNLPFTCLTQVDSASASADNVAAVGEMSGTASQDGSSVDVVDVAVVPLSHMEWRLRKLVASANITSAGNSTSLFELADGEDTDLQPVTNDTTPVITPVNDTETDAADIVDDTPVPNANNGTDSVVVMGLTQAGPQYASPWSACCSSYSELNPLVLNAEWDWRPITAASKQFGHGVSVAQGRFVAVSGVGSASVFDVLHPQSTQDSILASGVATAAGVDSPFTGASDELVSVSADAVVAIVTPRALNIRNTPTSRPHELALDVSGGVDGEAGELLGAFQATDQLFTSATPSGVFAATSFVGPVSSHGNYVAVVLAGVLGTSAARGVAVLDVRSSVTAVGIVSSTVPSYGEAVTLSSDDGGVLLAVGVPTVCVQGAAAGSSATRYGASCTTQPVAGAQAVSLYRVNGTGVFAIANVHPVDGAMAADSTFGAALAASGRFVVLGDANAGQRLGQVSVYAMDASGTRAEALCAIPGVVPGGGLGYSVAVVAAEEEGRDAGRNAGTALVVAGAPGANMASVIRVNYSAFEAGETGASVCQIVSALRQPTVQAAGVAALPPLYGAGTSVAIGGGMVMFSSPFAQTWQGGATPVSDALSGSGRLFAAAFCWAGDKRIPAVSSQANIPSVCVPCGGSGSEWSAGGISGVCEECDARVCRAADDDVYFSAVNNSAPLELGHEYEVDVTAVARSGRRNTQTSPAFRVDWTPPQTGWVQDAYVGNSTSCLYCNDDIDVNTNATYLAATWCCGWQDLESQVVSYSVAFGTEPYVYDMMDWTVVGLNESFVLYDVDLVSGQRYYACVVALNGAGLYSEPECSNGFMYDDTPPEMLFVYDGLQRGKDADAQSFLNLAFVNHLGRDNETDVVDYVFSLGLTPGGDELLAEESSGNATLNGVVNRPFDREPRDGDVMFANIRAVNLVGLSSPLMSSNGIAIGKAEVNLDEGESSTISLDTQYAKPSGAGDGNETDAGEEEEEPPKTLASVDFPAGAVGEAATFTGGAVTPQDIENGLAVNASETPPPAQNLKFGDYSFTLKAKKPGGGVQEGYQFEKPIIISMLYSVQKILDGESAPTDWEPSLTIYDVKTKEWIPAKLTCPPEKQWDEIIHAERRYSVAVCHLTQFALFFQKRPTAVLQEYAPDSMRVWTNFSTELARMVTVDAVASAGVEVVHIPLTRHPVTGALSGISVHFDGSESFDIDGTVTDRLWSVRGLNGATTAAATLSDASGMTTTLTPVSNGIVRMTLKVIDNSNGTRDADVWLWLDSPPVAALGPTATANTPAAANGVWPPVLVHAVVGDESFAAVVDGSKSWDPEGTPLAASWGIMPRSIGARYPGAADGVVPDIGSPSASPFTGVITGLPAGTTATVQLNVTAKDEGLGVDRATMQVVVNALPQLTVHAPTAVFLPLHNASVSIDVGDLDGTIVRRTWTFTPVRPAGVGGRTVVSDLGTGSVESVVISNVTERAEFILTVEVEDNDGGVVHSGDIRVVFKNPSSAIAEAVSPVTAVVSPPQWMGMTSLQFNGSKSYDLDGGLRAYRWHVPSVVVNGVSAPDVATAATAGFGSATSAEATLFRDYTAGDVTVALTVTDSDWVELTALVPVRVLLVPGFVDATSSGFISVLAPGTEVTLVASPALHPDVTVTKYEWSVTSSNLVHGGTCSPTLSVTTATGSPPSPETLLSNLCGAGEYTVSHTVTIMDSVDSSIHSQSAAVVVVVHDAPVARFNVTMLTASASTSRVTTVGRTETVWAVDSSDDRVALTYRWAAHPALVTFDDFTRHTTKMRAITAGRCTITLTVADDTLVKHTSTMDVWVMETTFTPVLEMGDHIVSRPPAFGPLVVPMVASQSTYVDGPVVDYTWSLDATTDPFTNAPTQVTPMLPNGTMSLPHMSVVNPPRAADYYFRLVVTAMDGSSATTRKRLRVLAVADPGPRISLPVPITEVALTAAFVQEHHFARNVEHTWSVQSFTALSAVDGLEPEPTACGATVVPPVTTKATATTPRLRALCGPGDYEVVLTVNVPHVIVAGEKPVDHTVSAVQVVHLHRPPAAQITLDVDAVDEPWFHSPDFVGVGTAELDLQLVTWVGHNRPLYVTSATSYDDDGAVLSKWNITRAVSGPPVVDVEHGHLQTELTGDDLAQFAVFGTHGEARTLVTTPRQGRGWITLTVTDSQGVSSNATAQVLVFANQADAEDYRSPNPGLPMWLIAVIALGGVICLGCCGFGLWTWTHRSPTHTKTVPIDSIIRSEPTDIASPRTAGWAASSAPQSHGGTVAPAQQFYSAAPATAPMPVVATGDQQQEGAGQSQPAAGSDLVSQVVGDAAAQPEISGSTDLVTAMLGDDQGASEPAKAADGAVPKLLNGSGDSVVPALMASNDQADVVSNLVSAADDAVVDEMVLPAHDFTTGPQSWRAASRPRGLVPLGGADGSTEGWPSDSGDTASKADAGAGAGAGAGGNADAGASPAHAKRE